MITNSSLGAKRHLHPPTAIRAAILLTGKNSVAVEKAFAQRCKDFHVQDVWVQEQGVDRCLKRRRVQQQCPVHWLEGADTDQRNGHNVIIRRLWISVLEYLHKYFYTSRRGGKSLNLYIFMYADSMLTRFWTW